MLPSSFLKPAQKLAEVAQKLPKAAQNIPKAARKLAKAAQKLPKPAHKLSKAAQKLPKAGLGRSAGLLWSPIRIQAPWPGPVVLGGNRTGQRVTVQAQYVESIHP